MKRMHRLGMCWVILMLLLPAALAFSQDTFNYRSDHYSVTTRVNQEFTEDTAVFMEAFFDLYTSYLHFDPELLDYKLKVRIFNSKAEYDKFLQDVIGETRSSFVFLHYPDPKKSELVAYHLDDQDAFNKKLIHHGFSQYLKSFVQNPPLWLHKGFAVYFEDSTYDPEMQKAVFNPNHTWLPSLRQKLRQDSSLSNPEIFIPVSSLLFLDQETAAQKLEAFYSQVWGMVHFFIHSEKKSYNRLIWDAISALEPEATLQQNERRVVNMAFEWVNKDTLVTDFIGFMQEELKTFPDLIQMGIDAYAKEEYEKAETAFTQAQSLRSDHYVPDYYLGLIAYNRGEFSMAEYYYLASVKKDGNSDLLYYALGVNALADNRLDDSSFYLEQAVENKGPYSDKAADLIDEVEKRAEHTAM
ncbi:MAG: DUF1570 domain-containing protein [Spirochaetia bacterium]|nr:DUF1570 domain-containing protein [Spirochaetia bacterium]